MTDVRAPRRVAVIGSPGSGKTSFALDLARIAGLELHHLDDVYWGPGWARPPEDQWRARVDELVARPTWVIDGNYTPTLAARLRRADAVVFFDRPVLLCCAALVRRTLRLRLGRAEYLPRSVRPGVDPAVESLSHLLWKAARFRRRHRPTILGELGRVGGQCDIRTIGRRRDAARLLAFARCHWARAETTP